MSTCSPQDILTEYMANISCKLKWRDNKKNAREIGFVFQNAFGENQTDWWMSMKLYLNLGLVTWNERHIKSDNRQSGK